MSLDEVLKAAGKTKTPKVKPRPESNNDIGDLFQDPPEREPTVRLNGDIPVALNEALAAKARKYRIPKTELVRRLLKHGLEELERLGK